MLRLRFRGELQMKNTVFVSVVVDQGAAVHQKNTGAIQKK